MAVDDDGNVYLTLMNQDKVQVYTESGRLFREWGKRGAGDGEFRQPGGMVLAPGGTVYVADQGNHRIQMCDTEGKFRGKWGEHGSGPGQFGGNETKGSRFGGPHFLARDSLGRIYTTEGTLGRVQQFSAVGKPLHAWGDKGSEPGEFGALKTGFSKNTFGPIGVFVDRRDRVWVSSLNDRVQAFTTDGKFLFGLGGTGHGPGQFARPHGMAVDSKGHLYVADAGNQRVQKFGIPDPGEHRPGEIPLGDREGTSFEECCIRKAGGAWGEAALGHGLADTRFCRTSELKITIGHRFLSARSPKARTEADPEFVGSLTDSSQCADRWEWNQRSRASVRRHRSRLILGFFGRSDRSAGEQLSSAGAAAPRALN
jgi:sugar lactone lactonase YvrE